MKRRLSGSTTAASGSPPNPVIGKKDGWGSWLSPDHPHHHLRFLLRLRSLHRGAALNVLQGAPEAFGTQEDLLAASALPCVLPRLTVLTGQNL